MKTSGTAGENCFCGNIWKTFWKQCQTTKKAWVG